MFNKVLIAEDIDTINLAVELTLEKLNINNIDHVKYCDDAVIKIKKALLDNQPYDLFITDLSFEEDHRTTLIKSGIEAIEHIRKVQPDLKIMVYSIEDKPQLIKKLIDEQNINAYIQKGRNSIDELTIAIEQISNNQNCYLSSNIKSILNNNINRQIDQFDLLLLQHLASGISQEEMVALFKQKDIKPNSLSTIEKRIANLKDQFKVKNIVHLIAITKDLGIA
jgi:two-component system, NarL family, captular synthesis response regulator RcsB